MPKRIVICCDGTWNSPDQKDRGKTCPSNVAKVALAALTRDARGKEQKIFYDKGVGTGLGLDRLLGGAFGVGLSRNIGDAYRYLVENYEDGDELFLFGFSRGAYTARSLGGLIRKCGVLRREYGKRYRDAYLLYRRRDTRSHPNGIEAQLFRKTFSHEIRIKFIGVWDTVGTLGMPIRGLRFINRLMGLEFHDVKLSSTVEHAYHAVAIDEKRKPFLPTLWEQQPHAVGQKMEQVWFAGVHTNIGGGYQDSGLSDLAFLWMKQKAEAAGLGFDENWIRENIHPNALGELRNSKTGLYRLAGDYHRPIGVQERGNETVYSQAIARYERVAGYRPKNLVEYISSMEKRN